MEPTRTETDLLGPAEVPASALYGVQTHRAIANFPVRGAHTLGDLPPLVDALMYVKEAAARMNGRIGDLSPRISEALALAAVAVREQRMYRDFPVHSLHGGGGTSANMNANEVLANIANESLGGTRGRYHPVHPNDHANRNQSTNDVYPAACHIAVILRWPSLRKTLNSLCEAFDVHTTSPEGSWSRLARTCLQDAVCTTFADFWSGARDMLQRASGRLDQAIDDLHAVPLGATVAGRRTDVPDAYYTGIVSELRDVTGDPEFRQSTNPFDALQNADDMGLVSSTLAGLANALVKIAHDLRLLSSGPEAGFGEIQLPAVQPGSSAMPGKINPVIPEFVVQVCLRVSGHDHTCQACLRHAELDLNVWESTIVTGILESMELMESAVTALTERCIRGLKVDAVANERHTQSIIPQLTRLMRQFGYEAVTELCREANFDPGAIRRLVQQRWPESMNE